MSRHLYDSNDDESNFQDSASRALGIAEDAGDAAADEAAIAAAPAFLAGHFLDREGKKVYIYTAAQPLTCRGCQGAINVDQKFTSILESAAIAVRFAYCGKCRRIPQDNPPTKRDGHAGIDANGGHDAGRTEREIPGARRPGPANPHEQAARYRKVFKLTEVLRKHDITAEQVAGMDERQWGLAAKAAGVNLPSAETRGLVVAHMRAGEPRRVA